MATGRQGVINLPHKILFPRQRGLITEGETVEGTPKTGVGLRSEAFVMFPSKLTRERGEGDKGEEEEEDEEEECGNGRGSG